MNLEDELNKPVKDIDEIPLTFGKHKGLTPDEVAEIDPEYIVWMYNTIEPKRCSKDLAIACEQGLEDGYF